MRYPFYRSITFFMLVSLGGCGIFDDKISKADKSRVKPGTEKVTDDWSCVADQKGRWDCFQSPGINSGPSEPASAPSEPAAAVVEPITIAPSPAGEAGESLAVGDAEAVGADGNPVAKEAYIKSNRDWQKLSSAAFVLQVAAHTSLASAENALTGMNAPGAEIVKTWSEQGDVFVIIAGRYPDRAAAEVAAEEFTTRNPDASYWIRSSAHLLKAL